MEDLQRGRMTRLRRDWEGQAAQFIEMRWSISRPLSASTMQRSTEFIIRETVGGDGSLKPWSNGPASSHK